VAITLKDLARMAGVAESTVSRALNDKPGVSEETKEKILKLADKHNYQPNRLAQGLAKNKTSVIALLLPDLKDLSYPGLIASVEKAANKAGYQVVLCNTAGSSQKAAGYLDLLQRNQFDGAIIVGGTPAEGKFLRLALENKNNMVLINMLLEELLLPSHLIDYQAEGILAAEHLLEENNVKPPLLVLGNEQEYAEMERKEGFITTCQQHLGSSGEIFSGVTDRAEGYQVFFNIVEKNQPPLAIYVTENFAALGLIEAIKTGGYLVPEDFQVIGTGSDFIADIISPKLTVVDEPLAKMAEEATEKLLKMLAEEEIDSEIKVYDPEIIAGGTT